MGEGCDGAVGQPDAACGKGGSLVVSVQSGSIRSFAVQIGCQGGIGLQRCLFNDFATPMKTPAVANSGLGPGGGVAMTRPRRGTSARTAFQGDRAGGCAAWSDWPYDRTCKGCFFELLGRGVRVVYSRGVQAEKGHATRGLCLDLGVGACPFRGGASVRGCEGSFRGEVSFLGHEEL